jgi:hypothetical protein
LKRKEGRKGTVRKRMNRQGMQPGERASERRERKKERKEVDVDIIWLVEMVNGSM